MNALRRAGLRAVALGGQTMGHQARGMAGKTTFYNPNKAIEAWAGER